MEWDTSAGSSKPRSGVAENGARRGNDVRSNNGRYAVESRHNTRNSQRRLTNYRMRTLNPALVALPFLLTFAVAELTGQVRPEERGSANIELLANVPLGGARPLDGVMSDGLRGLGRRTMGVEIEQELTRPFVYVARRFEPSGFDIVDIQDPERARRLFSWSIDGSASDRGPGALAGKYFSLEGRYYYVLAFQFDEDGPHHELGAIVFDVSGLPDTSSVREIVRVHGAETRGGFTDVFAYKHSDGRVLLFAAGRGPHALVYDAKLLIGGDADRALIGRVPTPDVLLDHPLYGEGYQSVFVGYHPASRQDRFYGSGAGGFYVYDVTDPAAPTQLALVSGVAGLRRGFHAHPSADGKYLVGEMAIRNMPTHIFDLTPALEGQTPSIRRPVGAWTADWTGFARAHDVRWPYVFFAALDAGLRVVNLMDPTEPYTMGYYYTWDGPRSTHVDGDSNVNGAWDVKVRNADGVIAVTDVVSGLWLFRMNDFVGWNGRRWGYPNVSSAQDWERGPDSPPTRRAGGGG